MRTQARLLAFSGGGKALAAQQSDLSVVSAASYGAKIAPDSLATLFGTGLARGHGERGAGCERTTAGGTGIDRVEVNGQAAALIYVSSSQINFVVPAGIAAGATTVYSEVHRYRSIQERDGAGCEHGARDLQFGCIGRRCRARSSTR